MYRRPHQPNSLVLRFWLRRETYYRRRVGVPGDDPILAAAFRDAQLLSDVFEKNRELPSNLPLAIRDEKNTEALDVSFLDALTSGFPEIVAWLRPPPRGASFLGLA